MWAQDYCTVCDKQCAPEAVYCSETCKMIELNRSSESLASSPGSFTYRMPSLRSPSSSEASYNHNHNHSHSHSNTSSHHKQQFLYDSPLLKPQSRASSATPTSAYAGELSPPPSPLLIPEAASTAHYAYGTIIGGSDYATLTPAQPRDSRLSQTSATYRQWLTAVV